jgi:hypothetical protein
MGGSGSGNFTRREGAKVPVEACLALDCKFLLRAGVLRLGVRLGGWWRWERPPGRVLRVARYELQGEDRERVGLLLSYPCGSPLQRVELRVTRPARGGARWWLLGCCGRRCAKLYLPPGGEFFACRACHRLSYGARQESHHVGAMTRHIAGRLGNDPAELRRVMARLARVAQRGLLMPPACPGAPVDLPGALP